MSTPDFGVLTRRKYLTIKALQYGAGLFAAIESVASVAIEHPEWDMLEEKSWPEWEAQA